jgi:eukaryotic-like serine/threonine-protein kinase
MTGTAIAPMPAASSVASDLTGDLTGDAALPPPRRRQRRSRRTTLSAGERVGAWRVDAELGRGGMGTVYAVTHSKIGKRAALKLCHESVLGERFTADTFLREARIVHLVGHPGVSDVFATGTHRGRPFLVMERLTGETLGARLDRGPLPREEALELLIEVCDVLAAAHRAGVVHRDLKLDNVFMLDAPTGARRTRLLDWGMARIVDEPDPMHEMIAGTLTYVAPEQIRGDALGPAVDVYSLAVLAYQVLLGEAPFTAPSDLDLLRLHERATPPPPDRLWPEIPGELAATLLAMLGKDPARRPPVTEVRRVLQAARAHLAAPVPARAPTPALALVLAPARARARTRARAHARAGARVARAWMRRVGGWLSLGWLARLAARPENAR